jgi:hypothetical protein
VLQHILLYPCHQTSDIYLHDAVAGTRNFVLMNCAAKLQSMHPEMQAGTLSELFNIFNDGEFVQSTLKEYTLYDVGNCASSVYVLIEGCVRFFKKGSSYSASDKDSGEISKQIQYARQRATATGPFSWMGHPECDVCRQLQGGKVRDKIDLGLIDLEQIPICRTCKIQLNSRSWMNPSDGCLKHYAPDRHHFLTLEQLTLFGFDYLDGSNVHKYKVSAFGRDTKILKVDRASLEGKKLFNFDLRSIYGKLTNAWDSIRWCTMETAENEAECSSGNRRIRSLGNSKECSVRKMHDEWISE